MAPEECCASGVPAGGPRNTSRGGTPKPSAESSAPCAPVGAPAWRGLGGARGWLDVQGPRPHRGAGRGGVLRT